MKTPADVVSTICKDTSASQIGKDIKLNLSNMNEKDKTELIKFIARVSETSYRRGFQQGSVLQKNGVIQTNPHELRYKRDIDEAPWGETATASGRTAINILECEYRNSFNDIGLGINSK